MKLIEDHKLSEKPAQSDNSLKQDSSLNNGELCSNVCIKMNIAGKKKSIKQPKSNI